MKYLLNVNIAHSPYPLAMEWFPSYLAFWPVCLILVTAMVWVIELMLTTIYPRGLNDAQFVQEENNMTSKPPHWVLASGIEHAADFPVAHGLIGERERAERPHLPRGAKKSAERGAGERASDTDPFDPDLG
jgi:hypothetical protein